MPWAMAFNAFAAGAVFAVSIPCHMFGKECRVAGAKICTETQLWNICWTVINAMAIYNLAVEAGHFEGFRR